MRNSISKAIIAGLAVLAMSAATLSIATPASARFGGAPGGGFHGAPMGGVRPMGGFGGFHGAPMGVRPGGFGGVQGVPPGVGPGAPAGAGVGPGWHGGLNQGSRHEGWQWHAGYWRHGRWYNGWWGPAFTGPYGGCWALEPIYDAGGDYLGQQYVNVCNWPYAP